MILTLNEIKQHNACSPETQLFEDIFGEQMLCNKKEFIKAINAGLNSNWFILHILTPQQRKEYKNKLHSIKHTYHKSLENLDSSAAQLVTNNYNLVKINILFTIIEEEF